MSQMAGRADGLRGAHADQCILIVPNTRLLKIAKMVPAGMNLTRRRSLVRCVNYANWYDRQLTAATDVWRPYPV